MYTAILIRIAIRIQRAWNESITRVTRSCHFSPINCDFFFSHLVSFRISLDNEKDILRRLMNGKDSRSRLNLSEYIARASRCSDFQLLSFSLFFFLFIPFNLPHGREFKWAQIVNTWDNEEFSRLCVNGQLWSFIKICEIKKKKGTSDPSPRDIETLRHRKL